ncbi:MAG: peptide deformylase [Gammaproteobacteria bacterium]|jgi:peptide deformylase|nr:peptide deformylase [Gammaproteobacteria bacterium]|tara:strand:+ start:5930 stop:6466 length:537 start_codon:yes stop_codon:yes gene_type:complete
MDKLKILHFPDNRLRQKGLDVDIFDKNLRNLAKDMLETMYDSKGIGLAAIQVNIQKRLIVIDISEEKNKPIFLVNPIILTKKNKIQFEEGCLSVPGFYEKVERFNNVTIKKQDLYGRTLEMEADGLLAVCIQHEIDHLDGKLFVDYISDMKRDRIAKKIKKLTEQGKLMPRKDVPYSI